jgi:hypothetical protein
MARVLVPVTDVRPVKASLTTALTGTNNDLVFTAARGGAWGNSIQIQYLDPGGVSSTLALEVQGFLLVVTLGRAASAIVTTAQQIMDLINSDLDAQALVSAALAAANDGTGVVTALAATSLAGGSFGTTLPAAINGDATNGHYVRGNDGRVVVRAISSDGSTRTVTFKRAPTLQGGVPAADEVISVPAGATVEMGPFATSEFDQNRLHDLYFVGSVSSTVDFLAYRVEQAT